MSESGNKWLIGCGIGCGVVLLVVIGLFMASFFFIKGSVDQFGAATETAEQVEQKWGDPAAYVPPADGAIAAGRMEVFLAVREATQPARENLAATWDALPMSEEEGRELEELPPWEKFKAVLGVTREAFGMTGRMADFFSARNRALLEHEMGFGEYAYIYVMAYHSYLDHDAERPERVGEEAGSRNQVTSEIARETWRGKVRGLVLDILRNQREAATDPAWQARLDEEIAALEKDRDRVPWQEGLPDRIRESLAPYRAELEATYDGLVAPFELARSEQDGMSIRME